MLFRSALRSLVPFAFFGSSLAQGTAWVVDDDGGPTVDFVSLQEAVNAASDGDAIIVRSGLYAGADVIGKSLTIAAETAAPGSAIVNSLGIRDLVASQSVHVQGLGLSSAVVVDCVGDVVLQDCEVRRFTGNAGPWVALVKRSDSVHFVGSEVRHDGSGEGLAPRRALIANNSTVFAYASSFVGGDGDTFCPASSDDETGGEGVEVNGGFFYASGCRFEGGDGGSLCPTPSFPGGVGLRAQKGATLYALDSEFVGGEDPQGGSPAAGIDASDATWTRIPGVHRGLDVTTPVSSGATLSVDLTGAPSDVVLVYIALAESPFFIEALNGPLFLEPPLELVFAGSLSPTGELDLSFHVPSIVTEFLRGSLQTIHGTASFNAFAGTPRSLLVFP